MAEINLLKPADGEDIIVDVNKSLYRAITKKYLGKSMLIIAASALLFCLIWIYSGPGDLLFLAFMLPVLAIAYLSRKIQAEFMKQFADKNNFQYYQSGSWTGELGFLFKRGERQSLYNLIVGNYEGRQFRLFNYSFKVAASGKKEHTYRYTVFDLEFKIDVPRLYLDAHGGKWFKDSLANGLVHLPLSAVEFEKKFKLYITPGSQIMALQIFTPDLMAELLDFDSKFDIELIGKQIYIYYEGEIGKAKKLSDMYKVATHVIESVGREAEKIRPT